MECVRQLCDLVNISDKIEHSLDWASIENSLGLTLPGDYKRLVEVFPDGRFQGFLRLIRPGDHKEDETQFLGYYRHRLDDMRRWREGEPTRFPWPLYPEPGGLLPWGVSIRGDIFFLITDDADPDSWSVVFAANDFSRWKQASYSVCGLLIELVTGQFDGGGVIPSALGGEPFFVSAGQENQAAAGREISRKLHWQRKHRGRWRVKHEFDKLSALLRPDSSGARANHVAIDERIGLSLPRDYVCFMDKFGPGYLADIAIIDPVQIPILAEQKAADIGHLPLLKSSLPPIFPESGGLIPWGKTDDGWVCYWAPIEEKPDHWGVVVSSPRIMMFNYHYTLSFSSFLVRYVETSSSFGFFTGREVELEESSVFTPD